MFRRIFKFGFVIFAVAGLFYNASAYENQFADGAKNVKLHWEKEVIPISISTSFFKDSPNIRSDGDILEIIKKSFAVWEKQANVKFEISVSDKLSISPAGKSGDGTSLISIAQTPENLLLFSKDSEAISARTRVFFNRRGILSEADIILNPYQQFSTDGSLGTYDLQATLTHEIGHLLGLNHSGVIGATMQENQGKNGLYNLPNFSARSLSDDDIVGIRGIYGAKSENKNCCGSISGSILEKNTIPADNFQIWLEESKTGRVAASVFTKADGRFAFEGLEKGEYRILAQRILNSAGGEKIPNAEILGKVKVLSGKITEFAGKFNGKITNFNISLIGFNGQLSTSAVPVNSGKSYTIYVSGKNIDSGKLNFGVDSPFIKVVPDSIIRHDYGKDISVVSFEIILDSDVSLGEYSVFAESEDGKRSYITGGISVGEFENPWSISSEF